MWTRRTFKAALLGTVAQAIEATSGTNILSTANLVTLDNEEAKIVVGQNVPFVTGSYTSSTSSIGGRYLIGRWSNNRPKMPTAMMKPIDPHTRMRLYSVWWPSRCDSVTTSYCDSTAFQKKL